MNHDTVVLAEVASLGLTAQARRDFRQRVLTRLLPVLPYELAIFHTAPPVPPGSEPVTAGLSGSAARRLRARWTSVAPDLADERVPRVLSSAEGAQLLTRLTAAVHAPSTLLLVPLRRGAQVRAWVLLGRGSGQFSAHDLERAELLAPVLSLADEHVLELPEAVGAALSGREAEIFEYLCRGFRNGDIAVALGTSPNTVRNQLARLYRKVGVCTRSELVGLASSVVRRVTH
jgi:DNA-binding CsgD family transcriptional regulator